MSFFRGYVRTKNKKCMDKFKDAELRTFDEVKDLPEYAGILAQDTVLIDVDDGESAEKLLSIVEAEDVLCQVRQTTRGMHFFFKNDGSWDKCFTGATLAIGIKADIKVGVKNSYSILKFGGHERDVIYDILENESYGSVPKWLHVVNTKMDLVNKAEGDGRNNALFSYILPLQESGFTKDEIIQVLGMVNKYIFSKPLSDSEFETITRDEAFDTALVPSFFEGKKFKFEAFAHYIVNQHHIKRVNGQLHLYRDGVYVSNQLMLERAMIDLVPTLSAQNRSEVQKYVEILCCDNHAMADVNFVAFGNGILDLRTDGLVPFDPSVVITNRIAWNYRGDAYNETVDKTLNKLACHDPQIRALLEEVAGYCLFRRNELRKSFCLTGGARGGKSSFINMLGQMLGEDNITALDMRDIGDRFRTAELFGKLANLGDDISERFVEDVSNFKKVVSGDKILVERKGKDPFFFSNYAKLIFSANELPRLRDRTQAVIDRMVIIPFDAQFSKDDPDYDPFISDKLKSREAIEYFIRVAVEGLKRVLERKAFTHSLKVEKALRGYNEEINPILIFFEDHEKDEFTREPIGYWYGEYVAHCVSYGCNAMTRTAFTKAVLEKYKDFEVHVKRVNGKNTRCFRQKRA